MITAKQIYEQKIEELMVEIQMIVEIHKHEAPVAQMLAEQFKLNPIYQEIGRLYVKIRSTQEG